MCMCECSYVHVKASSQEVQRNRSPCPQVFSGNWTQILCKNTKSQEFLTAESSIHSQRFLFLMMGGLHLCVEMYPWMQMPKEAR